MIVGECPYNDCEQSFMIACADDTPCFSKEVCEGCGRTFWELHSRISPEGYTEKEFFERYEVNEKTKMIEPNGKRDNNKPDTQ